MPAPSSSTGSNQVEVVAHRPAISALRWTVLLLSAAALVVFTPLWAPLLLAAFAAVVAAPLHERLSKRVGGRKVAAALFTVATIVGLLLPLLIVALSVYFAVADLATKLHGSQGPNDVWQRLASSGSGAPPMNLKGLVEFARGHAGSALQAAQSVFGAVATAALGAFVFVYGLHTFLIDGRRAYAWALRHSPIRRANLHRLGDAFSESARGLLIGVGLTALAQGFVATVGYVALGVPQAVVLGLLTCVTALIPSVGTAIVWVPVAIGLFVAGRTQAGVILLAIGALVSVVDNFIRPALSKFGELDLSTFLLLIAMLGGVTVFGAFGLLLGPLLVRLAIEGWEILHDEKLDAASEPSPVRELSFTRKQTGPRSRALAK